MGQQMTKTIAATDDIELAAAVDIVQIGADVGVLAGVGELGIRVQGNLAAALSESQPDVMVEFSGPAGAMSNIRRAMDRGVHCVVGSTGLTDENLAEVGKLAQVANVGAIVAPNFSLGANVMMKCAALAAKYFAEAEVIELHHSRKKDAPSGTALQTVKMMEAGRGGPFRAAPTETFTLAGVRGGNASGVAVHSVRLPGLVAHQEVIFGGLGETLTIRHDSTHHECFMPGVLMAIRRVRQVRGLVYGLDKLLD
jgi:4-hydroxy-tetrahydrodipicolinate reductase